MVKLPDPSALGAGPNFRAGGTAQVDDRILDRGARNIRAGGLAVADAIERGGNAMSRSMAVAGDAAARAAGVDIDAGRQVARSGAEMADAVSRGGARMADAVGTGGSRLARALESGGEAIAGATRRAGDMRAKAVLDVGNMQADSVRDSARYRAEGMRAEAAGMRAQAEGFSDLGRGLDRLASTAIEMQLASDQLDFSQRKSQWQIFKSNLEQKYQRDTDYETLSQRYEAELNAGRAHFGESITNPAFKRKFEMETALGATESVNRAKDRAFNVESSANRAQLGETLKGLQAAASDRNISDKERGEKLVDGRRYIDAAEKKGYLDPDQAQKARVKWAEDYSIGWVQSLTPDQQLELLRERPQGKEATLDRIAQVESDGRATAKSDRSSAFGAYQFVEGTWMSKIAKHRPDLLEGRSRAEVLALRADKKLSREIAGYLYNDNETFLRDRGVVATPTTMFMAHFLGAQGAVDVLKAAPGTPLREVLTQRDTKDKQPGQNAIKANPELLGSGTVDTFIAKLDRKMGSVRGTGTPIDFIPEHKRAQMEKAAETAVLKMESDRIAGTVEQFKFRINEMEHGRIPTFGRDEILQSGLPLKEINAVMEKYDAATKKQEGATLVKSLIANKLPVNGFDEKQRDGVDLEYRLRVQAGGDPGTEMLNIIRDTSGVIPKSAALALKAEVLSTDPKRVEQAAELASRALDINEHVFARDKDVAQAVTAYQYYRDELRYSPAQAAQLVIKKNDPEFKKELDIRKRSEPDVKKQIADKTAEGDLRSAFGDSWFSGPSVGVDSATRDGLMQDYRNLTMEHYFTHAKDIDEAKKQALAQLKQGGWGVTKVNGTATVTRFSPETSPVYQGIDNVSDRIAKQAQADIKMATGKDIDRSKIRLDYIPRQTAREWDTNQPPSYRLMFQNEDGVWQTILQDFRADPEIMRREIVEQRRQAFITANQASAANKQALPIGSIYGAP